MLYINHKPQKNCFITQKFSEAGRTWAERLHVDIVQAGEKIVCVQDV